MFGQSRVHRTNFNCCRKKLQDGITPQCHAKREPVSITLDIVKNSTIGPTRRRSRRKQRRNYSGRHKETIREEIQFYLPSSCCAILWYLIDCITLLYDWKPLEIIDKIAHKNVQQQSVMIWIIRNLLHCIDKVYYWMINSNKTLFHVRISCRWKFVVCFNVDID